METLAFVRIGSGVLQMELWTDSALEASVELHGFSWKWEYGMGGRIFGTAFCGPNSSQSLNTKRSQGLISMQTAKAGHHTLHGVAMPFSQRHFMLCRGADTATPSPSPIPMPWQPCLTDACGHENKAGNANTMMCFTEANWGKHFFFQRRKNS
uniref:Uncharacterized protein n=1 Tax=Eutreptiella gymnastica TaxID=73025 RepID=A0A7S4FSW2_9EUGL